MLEQETIWSCCVPGAVVCDEKGISATEGTTPVGSSCCAASLDGVRVSTGCVTFPIQTLHFTKDKHKECFSFSVICCMYIPTHLQQKAVLSHVALEVS